MAVSQGLIDGVFGRLALLLQPPEVLLQRRQEVVDCWVGLMGGFTDEQFATAARRLALELKRWPTPADFAEAMGAPALGLLAVQPHVVQTSGDQQPAGQGA